MSSDSEERVFCLLGTDGGGCPMSGVDYSIVGQDKEPTTDVIYQVVEVATSQVGSSDAALEEDIAREHAMFGSAIEYQAAGGMSGHMDGFELGMSEGDKVSIVQVAAQRHRLLVQGETEHAALFRGFVYPEFVSLVCFGFQPEFLQHERIAEDVVQVEMRVQQVLDVQPVFEDKVFQGLFLFLVIAAGVDDGSLVGFVPDDIAVLREHIEFKSLYFHGSLYWIE